MKFINSYSFVFSPRPGTVASKLDLVDKKIAEKRLKIVQKELFKHQLNRNKSLENKVMSVLVENQMKDKIKLFGRTEHMTSVIFDGDVSNIGKIVQVKINHSNQNSLFGEIKIDYDKKVA